MKNIRRKLIYSLLLTAGVLILLCVKDNERVNAANLSTIVYLSNGGTDFPPVTTTLNSKINSLPTPTREGYTFTGWYYNEECTWKVYTPFYADKDVIVLYAGWEKIAVVYLEAKYTEKTAYQDSLLDKKKVIVTATFSNNTKAVVTDFVILDAKVANLGTNYFTVTYDGAYAYFTVYGIKEPTYTVVFNSMGGSTVKPISGIKKDGKIALPADPVKSGYSFEGWYMENTYKTKFTKDTKITGNLVVYAKWEKEEVIVEKKEYKLNVKSLSLKINEQEALFVETYDPYLEYEVTFRSSNSSVASVSNGLETKGVVTGKKKGKAIISATVDDGEIRKTLKCTVTVKGKVKADNIKPSVSAKKIPLGGTYTIKVKFSPSNVSSKKLSFTSSNKKIATVNSSGKVTGKKRGTCYITVKTKDGSGILKKVKIIVS